MVSFTRRALLAATGTLTAAAAARNSAGAAPGTREGARGGMPDLAAVQPFAEGRAVAPISFTLADGTARSLADYAGQGVVLNLWATWCAPCVAEMPALDELARQVRSDRVAVLALSSDRGGAGVVERFFQKTGVRDLAVLLDPGAAATRALGARGLPTTLLLDREGRERARVEGAADWAGADAFALIRRAVG